MKIPALLSRNGGVWYYEPKPNMDITYLGHSSFRLSDRKVAVVMDPFDPSIGLSFPKVSAQIVTLSHGHSDHSNVGGVADVQKVIDGPGEYEIQGVSFIGISTYHDDKKGAERGRNIIFVVEMDSLRLAHLGDLGHKLSEAQLDAMGDIDILFVPVGGHYTIDAQKAVEVIQSIEPRIIVPMHYKTNKRPDSPLAPLDDFLKEIGQTPEPTNKFSIKAADLTDREQEVVVFS